MKKSDTLELLTAIGYILGSIVVGAMALVFFAVFYAIILSGNPFMIFMCLIVCGCLVMILFAYIREEKEKLEKQEKSKHPIQKTPTKFGTISRKNITLDECSPPRDEYWEMLTGTWKPTFSFKAVQDKWNDASKYDDL